MTIKETENILRENLIGATISDIRIRIDPDDMEDPGIALASDITLRVGTRIYKIVAEDAAVLRVERNRVRPLTLDDCNLEYLR